MHLTTYLDLLATAERTLGQSYRAVATGHHVDADVHYTCLRFARYCLDHADGLTLFVSRYDRMREAEPERLHPPGLTAARSGPVGLLRDLQDLYQLGNLVEITWTLVGQAAHGARDRDLIDLATRNEHDVTAQLAWLRTRMRFAAPQTLLVAS
ncbi:MAG: hypothetical protein LBJ87_08755 [bacterium]|jgi:hypothetical protein|nr:hypothetical protein [bacterium]